MHTMKVLSAGFGLLAICVLGGRAAEGRQGMAKGALVFLPLWLIGTGVNKRTPVDTLYLLLMGPRRTLTQDPTRL